MPLSDSDWFRKDDDVRWQWREATWTTNGSPKGEHNQAHQYPSPQRGNANFAWVQHFIHHLAPQGMASFVLVCFWFWVKSEAARALKGLDNATPKGREPRKRFPRARRPPPYLVPELQAERAKMKGQINYGLG